LEDREDFLLVLIVFLDNREVMKNYLDGLNQEQLEAVTFAGKNLLVLAGAGSGKTKTLITRIAHFIQAGIDPYYIVAVTFTNKAAKELKHRLTAVFPQAQGVHIGTFHRLSHLFLRKYGQFIGLNTNFQIITPSDQKRIFKNIFIKLNRAETQYCNQKSALSLLSEFYHNKNVQFDPNWQPIISAYIDHCSKDSLLDFDALIDKATLLYTQEEFKKKFSGLLQHILIDEFQDTNPSQFHWIRELADPGSKITLVGDDDQSIYGFRGADVKIIQKVSSTFQDIFTIRLEQNYRSTPAILKIANQVIACNKNRLGKDLWTSNTDDLRPIVIETLDEYQEAQEVSRQIHQLLNKGAKFSEIAVLYRSNALSRLLEAEARKYHWPYRVSGGLPFFDREEIRDIMSYLQLISDPRQNNAFLRVINKPARKIGLKTQEVLIDYANRYDVALWDALLALLPTFSAATKKALQGFVELIQMLKVYTLQASSLADVTHMILQQTELLLLYKQGELSESKEDNLYEFTRALLDFQAGSPQIAVIDLLSLFLNEYLLDDSPLESKDTDCLVFSTCHGAKGLEWPYVFLIGMEKNLFPHEQSHREDEIEEERRLFYVAITRAKKQLRISYALKRQKFNEILYPDPSPFLYEIRQEDIQWIGKKNKKSLVSVKKDKTSKRVKHHIFGEGEVIMLDLSEDVITINFDRVGQKMLRYSLAQKMIQDL
jgi:DNA helicase-2/ATP-dependent DNA helicase PcrA